MHEHKWFLFKIMEKYEPTDGTISTTGGITLRLVEYAYFGCNCGEAIKRKVKDESSTSVS